MALLLVPLTLVEPLKLVALFIIGASAFSLWSGAAFSSSQAKADDAELVR